MPRRLRSMSTLSLNSTCLLYTSPTKQKLREVRHEHFSAKTANRKITLREKDKVLREKLARLLADDKDFAPEDAIQLAAWNPYDLSLIHI